jgi:hypothetical protein
MDRDIGLAFKQGSLNPRYEYTLVSELVDRLVGTNVTLGAQWDHREFGFRPDGLNPIDDDLCLGASQSAGAGGDPQRGDAVCYDPSPSVSGGPAGTEPAVAEPASRSSTDCLIKARAPSMAATTL